MRSYFFSILLLSFSLISSAQNYDAKSNALGGCGLSTLIPSSTQTITAYIINQNKYIILENDPLLLGVTTYIRHNT